MTPELQAWLDDWTSHQACILVDTEPLVWVALPDGRHANIPERLLTYFHEWHVVCPDPPELHLVEGYRLGEAVVKRGVHIFKPQAPVPPSAAEQGRVGG